MHPLEGKIANPFVPADAPKIDPEAPNRIRLQALLGPLIGLTGHYRAQIEAQVPELKLSPAQKVELDGAIAALRALEQHAKRLVP